MVRWFNVLHAHFVAMHAAGRFLADGTGAEYLSGGHKMYVAFDLAIACPCASKCPTVLRAGSSVITLSVPCSKKPMVLLVTLSAMCTPR